MKKECQWRSISKFETDRRYRHSNFERIQKRNFFIDVYYRESSFFKRTNPSNIEKAELWNLLATPDALGSLCVFFMCSTRASPPNTTLWHIGQGVAVAPPIMSAACCCKTPRCSWSSCSTGGGDAGIAVQRLGHIHHKKTHKQQKYTVEREFWTKYFGQTDKFWFCKVQNNVNCQFWNCM